MKGPMLICIFFERINTEENPSFFLHQPRTSYEYCLCILAMFTMSRKDVKYVNWPSLEVLSLRVCKCETGRERLLSFGFPMTF